MGGFSFPARLYPIIDPLDQPADTCVALARAVLSGGAPLIQLRLKRTATGTVVALARRVKAMADRYGAQLIINDRCDVAKLIDAAGVHLGQDDLPPAAAREILGAGKIIGFSTHTLQQAAVAARAGVADYIGFGPIYPTTSKLQPDPAQGLAGLRVTRAQVRLPIAAIGGISADTLRPVLDAGADAVAMIGEIVRAADVTTAVRVLLGAAHAASPSVAAPHP